MDSITIKSTTINLTMGDIVAAKVDAIVNAANSELAGDGGVDGAIHRAGGPDIHVACHEIFQKQGPLPPGKAVITTAGNLPAKCVIHTVGPIWYGGKNSEAETLASAYIESLKLATANNLESVAFPSLSTGAYHYPVDQASKIALETVADYLRSNETSLKEVRFVLYDTKTYDAYARDLTEIAS
ncbi:O-acetyl-ADP-ribose deacetylase (regulator of RNase III), contains Macro domain [Dehalogenimonas formicexedens]|uniref:O-acetyl-ADP-ribose deacetylase (Regulator of RNase III), contains Macro domain n=1 Tax=Dehalogenimonas formicexedens TaxID=1839801 RepID=A0A1P8F7T7_9CHLR|nr:O-acetyl-ADP-ribose deacetylase [Dehalogenimonas formicexedens]APV44493.1 O-acetyl-ADP-ribose deacetylase (regulator of RNase III), contains Macro domain [Dehalogenimonas formicexedens]